MINKAIAWRDRIAVLSTETEHKEHVHEHLEILDFLIDRAKTCDIMEMQVEIPERIEVSK